MTRANRRPRLQRPPRADAAIGAALWERLAAGDVYSYSYDHERGCWTTWETLHDFDATERNGRFRCYCVPRSTCDAHGPTDWQRADLVAFLNAL